MNFKVISVTILESKLVYLGATILGVLIGTTFPAFSETLGLIGDVFVNLVKMCVLPVVICSVTLSISNFLTMKREQSYSRIFIVLFLIFLTASIIGCGTAILLEPGSHINLGANNQLKDLSDAAAQTKLRLDDPLEVRLAQSTLQFIFGAVPNNIFNALATNSIFQVIIFSIIFGIGLGKYARPEAEIVMFIDQTREIFMKTLGVIIYFFPIVMFLLISRTTSHMGADTLIGMGGFILKFYIAASILLTLSVIVLKIRTRTTFAQSFAIMQDPVLVGLATQSTFASMPSSMIALERFGFDAKLVQLLIPLGNILARFDYVLYFGFCSIFAVQVYGIHLSLTEYSLVIFMIIFTTLSASGQSGTTALATLGLILTPIGIPIAGILPLLIAVASLIDPMRILVMIHTNCTTLALIGTPSGILLTTEEAKAEEAEMAAKV